MKGTNMIDVFVIHSERDNVILKKIEEYFQKQFYWDKNDEILSMVKMEYLDSKDNDYVGENFAKKIRKNIRNCNLYLIILTENSKCSKWVNQEIGAAHFNSQTKCMVFMERGLRGGSFGFIHPNYDVEYFNYEGFKIDEKGTEVKKIEKKIKKNLSKIPHPVINIPTDPEKDDLGKFEELKEKQ